MHWECPDIAQSSDLQPNSNQPLIRARDLLSISQTSRLPEVLVYTGNAVQNLQHGQDTLMGTHVSVGDNLGWSNHWSKEEHPAFCNTSLAHLHPPDFMLSTGSAAKCPTNALCASPLCKLRSCQDSSHRGFSSAKFWTPWLARLLPFKITYFNIILEQHENTSPRLSEYWFLPSWVREVLHETPHPAQQADPVAFPELSDWECLECKHSWVSESGWGVGWKQL